MWNRDLKLKLWLITITGVTALVFLIRHDMWFDVRSGVTAYGTVALLLPFAILFDNRKLDAFSNLLTGFLCMVGFNFFLTILTYAGTPLNAPLADDYLMAGDAAMGVHLPSIVEWAVAHPTLRWLLSASYVSVFPSTLLAIFVLGLDPDVRRLREFVTHFILAGMLTTLIFFFLPAAGPFAAYGYEPRPDQQRFIDHFFALRAGEFPLVSLTNLEGLITFPSFHTSWALLVAWAFRPYRWLFPPMLIVNLAVVASTLTTGWHYGCDVVGGILITLVSIGITHILRPWVSQSPSPANSAPEAALA